MREGEGEKEGEEREGRKVHGLRRRQKSKRRARQQTQPQSRANETDSRVQEAQTRQVADRFPLFRRFSPPIDQLSKLFFAASCRLLENLYSRQTQRARCLHVRKGGETKKEGSQLQDGKQEKSKRRKKDQRGKVIKEERRTAPAPP
jgi:hypothetical protein